MRIRLLLVSLPTLLLVLCAMVPAQVLVTGTSQGVLVRGAQVGDAPGVPGQITADAVALGPVETGPAVKGAPYSAEATTEVVQTFADGNRIVRRTSALLYRDSRGRTRREVALGDIAGITITGEPLRAITISDPDSSLTYLVNPDNSTRVIRRPPSAGQTITTGPLPMPPVRQREPRATTTPAATTQEESLGTREIEGVVAEGTRRTVTIPAGAIGNERAIESVTERWFSPELQIVVMSRQRDPRFGETVYRLTNITRTEPPAALFELPPDVPAPR